MRVALLLMILALVSVAGNELGFIASHYEYLEKVYLDGLTAAELSVKHMKEERDACRKLTGGMVGTL